MIEIPSQEILVVEPDLEFGLPDPPTPEEIIELTQEIRREWSEYQRQRRNIQAWVVSVLVGQC